MTDTSPSTPSVVLERTLEAPVELVWDMWTKAEHFASWYGPKGASIEIRSMNVEVGGGRHFCMEMQTPNGPMKMWFKGQYRVIDPCRRLLYTESMSDEDGNVVSPSDLGMPEGHPEVTEIIVELEDLGGRTRLVVTHVGVPADSPGAAGWNMALDKLVARVDAMR